MSYDSGMTLVQLNAVTAERDALRAELADLREQKPVAEVIACNEVDLDGYPLGVHQLDWVPIDLDALPIGTKLYAAPTAQPVPYSKVYTDPAELVRDALSTPDLPTSENGWLHLLDMKTAEAWQAGYTQGKKRVEAAPVSAEDALLQAAESALHYMDSVGQMDMYPSEWQVAQALRAALASKGAQP
jgi:hypothetical protein